MTGDKSINVSSIETPDIGRGLVPALSSIIETALDKTSPIKNAVTPPKFLVVDDERSEPPGVEVLSTGKGRSHDTFRIELEVSFEIALWLARIGAAFWPIFGAVEEKINRERVLAAREEKRRRRTKARRLAEREGYFRARREESKKDREQTFEEIGNRLGVQTAAVKIWVNQFKQKHEQKLRLRRNARIVWRRSQGVSIQDIARNFRLSVSAIRTVLRNQGSENSGNY